MRLTVDGSLDGFSYLGVDIMGIGDVTPQAEPILGIGDDEVDRTQVGERFRESRCQRCVADVDQRALEHIGLEDTAKTHHSAVGQYVESGDPAQ